MATTRELLGEERREQILRWLATEGKVLASDLGERLGVSLDTVRRDLQELAAAGALRRVHGDVCMLSACSLPPAVGVTLRDRDEALVVGEMVARSGRVISLTTAAKLGTAGPYPAAELERIDTLVTDAPADELVVYRELGIDVVRA